MEPRISIRTGVGIGASILQKQDLEFKRLFIERPMLITVQRGSKLVQWSNGEFIIQAGDAIALAGGQSFNITNRVADDGSYRAHWLVWDDKLLSVYANQHISQAVIRTALPLVQPPAEFSASFQRALLAVENDDLPLEIARARVNEMLLWVGMLGGRFAPPDSITPANKVRRLIGRDLAKDWNAVAVASELAMSEATLRRKLADEGTSFSEIVIDARLSFALTLLQSSNLSVTQIALTVGYQTPSHFAVRFRERFGFPPTAIRKRVMEPADLESP